MNDPKRRGGGGGKTISKGGKEREKERERETQIGLTRFTLCYNGAWKMR